MHLRLRLLSLTLVGAREALVTVVGIVAVDSLALDRIVY